MWEGKFERKQKEHKKKIWEENLRIIILMKTYIYIPEIWDWEGYMEMKRSGSRARYWRGSIKWHG